MIEVYEGHCPLGAPFYDGEGCIGCGFCTAITEEEVKIARDKLSKYLEMDPQERKDFLQKGAYFVKV